MACSWSEERCSSGEPPPAEARSAWLRAWSRRLSVVVLLAAHATVVAYQGWSYSPTIDEPAHLVAGLAHWETGCFELYRVNPPLVRLLASAPLFLVGCRSGWDGPGGRPEPRPEFSVGSAFCTAEGTKVFRDVTLARWACLPLSLLGGYVCYRWARDLHGTASGLFALALWCFCPNILGNSALITPDAGAASLGVAAGYSFWLWLRAPGWKHALFAGGTLGLAELTKSTWVVLLVLWPLLGFLWNVARRTDPEAIQPGPRRGDGGASSLSIRPLQLAGILLIALYILNLGYGFEGSFQRLGRFAFVSSILGGPDARRKPANRFVDCWLAELPMPVPANYLRGIDVQWHEFEEPQWSYLEGELKKGGWWYYYLYALRAKVPAGTLGLAMLACAASSLQVLGLAWSRIRGSRRPTTAEAAGRVASQAPVGSMDELVVLAPAVVVLVLVSSRTGLNSGLRYVLPALPFVFIWMSRLVRLPVAVAAREPLSAALSGADARAAVPRPRRFFLGFAFLTLASSVLSSLAVCPHSLSYFNEPSGGPENGPEHLLDSNLDWGQDLLELKRWYDAHPEARPFHLAYFGVVDPRTAGIDFDLVPRALVEGPSRSVAPAEPESSRGWHAVSVSGIYGYRLNGPEGRNYTWLRKFRPVAKAGYSIWIYHVTTDDAHRVRRRLDAVSPGPER